MFLLFMTLQVCGLKIISIISFAETRRGVSLLGYIILLLIYYIGPMLQNYPLHPEMTNSFLVIILNGFG